MHFELLEGDIDVCIVHNFDASIEFEFLNSEINGELGSSIDSLNIELEVGISKESQVRVFFFHCKVIDLPEGVFDINWAI